MQKKSWRPIILILTAAALVALIVIVLPKITGMNGENAQTENFMVGGDNDHWYYADGVIESIDYDRRIIDVIDVENSGGLIDSDTIRLDCGDAFSFKIASLEPGQKIQFAFFKWQVHGSEVKGEYLEVLTED
jgi:hypothetical protein